MILKKTLKSLALATALTGAFAVAQKAEAATFGQTATIDVLTALAVSETQKLDFGRIEVVSGAPETVIVTIGSTTGTGTATFIDNTVAEGQYDITGSSTNTISISASGTDAGGFTWSALVGDYNGGTAIADLTTGATTLAAPGAGTSLSVGATLSVANTVTDGTYTPAFDIVVDYD